MRPHSRTWSASARTACTERWPRLLRSFLYPGLSLSGLSRPMMGCSLLETQKSTRTPSASTSSGISKPNVPPRLQGVSLWTGRGSLDRHSSHKMRPSRWAGMGFLASSRCAITKSTIQMHQVVKGMSNSPNSKRVTNMVVR